MAAAAPVRYGTFEHHRSTTPGCSKLGRAWLEDLTQHSAASTVTNTAMAMLGNTKHIWPPSSGLGYSNRSSVRALRDRAPALPTVSEWRTGSRCLLNGAP